MRKFPGIALLMILFSVTYLWADTPAEKPEKMDPVYDDHGRRDPFWSLVDAQGIIINYDKKDLAITDLLLEGIMMGHAGDNLAIVNGNIVRTGDTIGAFVVERIDFNAVFLKRGPERFSLRLKKEE